MTRSRLSDRFCPGRDSNSLWAIPPLPEASVLADRAGRLVTVTVAP